MTVAPNQTGPVCPQCGATLPPAESAPGQEAFCPFCGASLTAQPAIARLRRRLDPLAGWGVSLLLHAILLVSLAYIVMTVGYGQGVKDAEVGVIGDHEGPSIEKGSATLNASETVTPEVGSLTVSDSVTEIRDVTLVSTVNVPSSSAPMQAVIGLSGGGQAKGDWNGVSLAGGGGGGGGQFFGLEARGSKFVYVLDHSGSMGEMKKLETLKIELAESVRSLKGNCKFFMIFYDHNYIKMESPDLVAATKENKEKYLAWAETMRSGGGTDPTEAMKEALALKPDAIWLLSDGLFPERVADAIKAANPEAKVQIHTIAFFEDSGKEVLSRIAEENRGKYRFIPPMAPKR
jgi:hypothetical protein